MKRIYIIRESSTGREHFAEAGTRAEALRLVASEAYSVSVATTQEVARAAKENRLSILGGAENEQTAND